MADIARFSHSLRLSDEGIWFADTIESISYPPDANDSCFTVEEGSFWFEHRNRCITAVVRQHPPRSHGPIFDVGGGNGFVAKALESVGFEAVVVEPGVAGARNARKRGISDVICSSLKAADFLPGSLPAAGLFDVLEHVEDDVAFLTSLRRVMNASGRLYLTVPSYQFLWSANDVSAGHYRRHTLRTIETTLRRGGFSVDFASYIFCPLPVALLLTRTIPYRIGLTRPTRNRTRTARDHAVRASARARLLRFLLHSEPERLSRGETIPFGSSCLVAASAA